MFARFTRLSLRRCVHTASTTPRPWSKSVKVVFGASAATAAYMTWQLTNEHNRLALDSINPKITRDSTTSPSLSFPADSSPESSASETKSPFIPDPEQHETQESSSGETGGEISESSGSGAYNPQTGEINWDCPCLGGMAHGPCGPEFREAFSCFIFSEVEPKGIDCVERFKAMQTCFRAHPEVYADEIMDDDEDDEPVNSENSQGLPPVLDSPEIVNDTAIPDDTPKEPHIQKAGRDR